MSIATSYVCDVRVVSSAIVVPSSAPNVDPRMLPYRRPTLILQVLRLGVLLETDRRLGLPAGGPADLQPAGKPMDNPFIESFNGRLRDQYLNVELFFSIVDAQQKILESQ